MTGDERLGLLRRMKEGGCALTESELNDLNVADLRAEHRLRARALVEAMDLIEQTPWTLRSDLDSADKWDARFLVEWEMANRAPDLAVIKKRVEDATEYKNQHIPETRKDA